MFKKANIILLMLLFSITIIFFNCKKGEKKTANPSSPLSDINLDSTISFALNGTNHSIETIDYYGKYYTTGKYTKYDSDTIGNKNIMIRFPGQIAGTYSTLDNASFELTINGKSYYASPEKITVSMVIEVTAYGDVNDKITGTFGGEAIDDFNNTCTISAGAFEFTRDNDE